MPRYFALLSFIANQDASWECQDELATPSITASATVDAQGRPVSYGCSSWQIPLGETIAYSHDAAGRLVEVHRFRWLPTGDSITRTSTMNYDAAGRLTLIGLRVNSLKNAPLRSDSTYTVVAAGALPTELLLTRKDYTFGFPIKPDYTIRLTYDGSGRIIERLVYEVTATGERISSRLGFQFDGRGFLTRQLLQQYQYPGSVVETEATWCLDWLSYTDSALAAEGHCPSWSTPSWSTNDGIRYPYGRMPSLPLTVFPAYVGSSALDLLCVITDECADPKRLRPRP